MEKNNRKKMGLLKKMINALTRIRDNRVESARFKALKARDKAHKTIDNIYAQLDGCGDTWFLSPKLPIQECNDENNTNSNE